MEQQYIIEMRHITKRFPGIVANDDITIQIKTNEIYAILGENGAGKSTLMSQLFGMYEPDEGEIYIKGEKVRLTSASSASARNVGMVHQHFKLVDNYTVAENIVLCIEPQKKLLGFLPYVQMKQANERIRVLSEQYGLEVDPEKTVMDIGICTRQRVEILKMLYREADILIFDEPTAILTPQEIDSLLNIITELRNSGKTIILITHKLEEIKRIADRCAILCRGKLIDVMDVATTTTQQMASLMVGREFIYTSHRKRHKFGSACLRVEHLTVRNEDRLDVVKDVSFSVRNGEIFAVAGVSGNGQVELADAIMGIAKVASGKVYLNGLDITEEPIRKRIEAGIAYIPEDRQNVGTIMDMTLQENLAIKNFYKAPFSHKGILQPDAFKQNADCLIEKYDIRSGQGAKAVVRSMSGGNQQKAIVAREIEMPSSLIIFVQPTRGLDVGAIETIHSRILQERNAGKAILLISLELDEIMDLADTIGVIYNGELLKIADTEQLTPQDIGNYMMGVKVHE